MMMIIIMILLFRIPVAVKTPKELKNGTLLSTLNEDNELDENDYRGFQVLHTKDPVFENGNYRLNFKGLIHF